MTGRTVGGGRCVGGILYRQQPQARDQQEPRRVRVSDVLAERDLFWPHSLHSLTQTIPSQQETSRMSYDHWNNTAEDDDDELQDFSVC